MTPSDEQQKIIYHVSLGHNVSVNAVAGSGKSTVVIMTAKRLPHQRFLQITYNSQLRKEIKEKIEGMPVPLTNIAVHTYHSLAVQYYSRAAWTDIDMQHVVFKNPPALTTLPIYDIVVLDEIQDMTLLYFSLVVKFLKDMCEQNRGHKIQLLVLGDVMQGLYDFKGADTRFLTHASEIWQGFPYLRDPSPFVECTLRISYRITSPMAAFVNRVMLGEERMVADKPGCPVRYVRNRLDNLATRVCHIIRELIKKGHARPEDIFILAGSVRGGNISTTKLENLLVLHDIPCYVPRDQQDHLDDRVIHGKVVFSTFHAVKGRQRPHVFVMDYDNSYFTFLGKGLPSTRCPNTLYVACTRASESLYLFEKSGDIDRPMDFHKMGHYEMKQQNWIQFEGTDQSVFYTAKPGKEGKIKTHIVRPTDLIKFMGETVVNWCSAFVERAFRQLHEDTAEIAIPTVVETTAGFYEDVSDINGIAIPPIFFSRMAGGESQSTVFHEIVGDILATKNRRQDHAFLANIYDTRMPRECKTIADWLLSANLYSAASDGLYSKLKQLGDNYTWLSEDDMQKCADRMNSVMFGGGATAAGLRVEVAIADPADEEHAVALARVLTPHHEEILGERAPPTRFLFSARVDLITHDRLWELKCTKEMVLEHFLQLAVYAWLWQVIYPEEPKEFRLFNIRTGEHYLLDCSLDELTELVVVLLRGKYGVPAEKTDGDFLTDVRGVIQAAAAAAAHT